MRPRALALTVLLVAALAGMLPGSIPPAHAAAGALDTSFNGTGTVVTQLGFQVQGNAVAVQADGRIVVAGNNLTGADDFTLARYNTDGSLDTTFDGDGIVTTSITSGTDQAAAVAVQPDGKIIAAGTADVGSAADDFALVRYNPDGSLDTTFDGDGIVTTALGGLDQAYAVAMQPNGRIVVAGNSPGAGVDFALVRYNPDGSLDTTFDGDGIVTTSISSNSDRAYAVALRPDGKIVAAGSSLFVGDYNFALARYNADGSLDTSFDTDGKLTTPFGLNDQAYGVAVQPDGKTVAAGLSNSDFALARYNADGSLDSTFDGDGKLTTPAGNPLPVRNAVALEPDGKILVSGTSANGTDWDFLLVRYNLDGSLDTSFDADGRVLTSFGPFHDEAHAVALTADGKIVVAGTANGGAFGLARYDWTTCTITGTSGNDKLKGTPNADVICGLGGNDELTGLGGNDILIGGDGNDTLLGGTGNDALLGGTGLDMAGFYDSKVTGPVTVNLLAGTATNAVLGTDAILRVGGLSTVEKIKAGPGNDTITGDAGSNILEGREGNDLVTGGGGNDLLIGNTGDDTLNGGDGNDTLEPGVGAADVLNGDAGIDGAYFSELAGPVTASLAAGVAGDGGVNASLNSIENLFGSKGDDFLYGDIQVNAIYGQGGDDVIDVSGDIAADLAHGGAGANDVCFADPNDTVDPSCES